MRTLILEAFSQSLTDIENRFGELFHRLEWISFGGGIHYIDQNYPLDKFINRLKNFSETYGVQIYLEPGRRQYIKVLFL